jgi:hypothetical protein
MNAISPRPAIHHELHLDPGPDAHSDALTELARHQFDLRVHALVMLASAGLAVFTGARLCDAADTSVSVDAAPVPMPFDILSFCALGVFVGIAALCLFEAHRCWRKAAITGLHATIKPKQAAIFDDATANRAIRTEPAAVAGFFSRIRHLEPS